MTPLVLLGEHVGESTFPHVTVDNTAAARAATEHLLALGCRRIAALGAQESGPIETSTLRLEGYRPPFRAPGIYAAERPLPPVNPFPGSVRDAEAPTRSASS